MEGLLPDQQQELALEEQEFTWSNDEDSIVVADRGIAVYRNYAGEIVVRQRSIFERDDDLFIVIERKDAQKVAAAIVALATDGQE
jgi:hypothetical protein